MTAPPVTSTDQTNEAADETVARSPWSSLRWGLVVSLVAAVLCTFVLEMSQLIGASSHWWATTFLGTAFLVDCLIVWLVLVVLIGLTNRVILPIGVVTAFVFIIAVANWVKLGIRAEPVYPSDIDFISEPGFLSTMVSPKSLIMALFVVVVLVVGSVMLARKFERRLVAIWPEHLPFRKQLMAVGIRAVIVTTAIALLVSTTGFNEHGNIWRKLYNLSGDRWRYWNQETNYQAHGFLGGFLYNMPTTAMKEPVGYTPETMAALTAKYTRAADKINKTRTGTLDHTNVVVVLSESFSDPTHLKGFQLAQDPIPRVRNLLGRTTSGTMMTQLYGGGTANMEFETLTGQSIGLFTPQLSSPYQMLVSSYPKYPSAVGWFAAHGHDPIAVHPYMTGMYKRNTVYKTFGFTKFIHDSTMGEAHKIDHGQYISDQSAFDEVERQINGSSDPLMVNLVTMQNHIPMTDAYHDPIPAAGITGSEADRVSNYARGINHTDEALAKFLTDLRQSKEKTVVIFYGDHLPGIYSGDVRDKNTDLDIHETPFFLWSNRGPLTYKPQPITSPIYFLPMLYQLENAPIPPYFAMLQQLRTQVAAIEQGRILTPAGVQVDRAALPPRGQQLLDDAELVQYDFSIGKRYAVDQMWPGSIRTDDPAAAWPAENLPTP